MTAPARDPLLRTTEVASWLSVSRDTVYNLARSGQLAYIQVGDQFRFLESAVRAYLDANTRGGPAGAGPGAAGSASRRRPAVPALAPVPRSSTAGVARGPRHRV